MAPRVGGRREVTAAAQDPSAPGPGVPASLLRLAGPGLIVAATGVGSGDIISATVGGASFGVVLLWAIALGAFFKFVVNEGIARFQLATGLTAIEGWTKYCPWWVQGYFAVYLVAWTVAVSAALTNATGMGIANLTDNAVSRPWGAVLHSILGFGFVLLGGYNVFEKVMKALVGVMAFSLLVCALLTMEDVGATFRGLLIPSVPEGSGGYVLSVIGGIGGSITILSYNYWMREERMVGAGHLRYLRGDMAIAYLFTAVFGISVMLIANRTFFVPGIAISDAQAVPGTAEALGALLGPLAGYVYSIGFWAAVFTSLLGVWQSVPYMYADLYGILKALPDVDRTEITKVTSTPYRVALLFITLAPMPFAFIGRPLLVIVTYTIIGSLFIPFLAATLLYLNNKVPWTPSVPHNHWTTNVLLIVILVMFMAAGIQEVLGAL